MGLIYKITNIQNGQIYIGKTNRDLHTRWLEHLRDAKNKDCSTIPLHNAINKYGEQSFKIEIIKDNIPTENLDEQEKYYISLFNSYNNGYNATLGGDGGKTKSKLSDEDVEKIIQILSDKNIIQSLEQIAKKFDVNKSTIESINTGKSWKKEGLEYPIRKYSTTGITLLKNQYSDIVNLIKNSNLTLKEIREKYNLSEDQITSINLGKYCYDGKHEYYKDIYSGPFPIRQDKRQKIDDKDFFIPIFYDVIFTNQSMAKIGNKYNIQGNTLAYICRGNRRLELTSDFILPMRQNIEENKKIFLQLYPEYEKR